ncbi:MAG: DnaB-like helicase C-terminal domain-containing protein [Bacilli bacterium]|nr:DnaB-like helicase C-terminal domain-containing protein [Bacilli bacterium]MDD4795785.1 DnaB-like helicase C-terminal domain-containing protein [Bacilli bacterium]
MFKITNKHSSEETNRLFKTKFEIIQKKIQSINSDNETVSLLDFVEDLKKLIDSCNQLIREPILEEIVKLTTILNEYGANENFFLQLNRLQEITQVETFEDDFKPINNTFVEKYDSQHKKDGISLLNSNIDEITGGLHPGEVATIVGGSGSMKTTYAINICYQAIKQGKNVCFLSLEETPLTLYSKLLSRVSVDLNKNFSVQDITQHKLSGEDTAVLKEEVHPYLESLPGKFYILSENDLLDFSQNTIMKKLKYIDKLIKDNSKDKNELNQGIDIIVVDHLQMFKYVVTEKKDEYQLMNMYVSFFRKMSKHFIKEGREVLVILLSQCNREGIAYARRNDGSYLMQHVAEASEIERSSSYIISVYTDEFTQISKDIKIGAVKFRNSPLLMGTINTFADGKYYQIGENHKPKVKDYSTDDLDLDNQSLNDLDSMLKPNNIF